MHILQVYFALFSLLHYCCTCDATDSVKQSNGESEGKRSLIWLEPGPETTTTLSTTAENSIPEDKQTDGTTMRPFRSSNNTDPEAAENQAESNPMQVCYVLQYVMLCNVRVMR